MSLTPYSQPPVCVKQSKSRLITSCYSFPVLYTPVLYTPVSVLSSLGRAARCQALSNGTFLGRRLPKPIRRSELCKVRLLTVQLAPSFNWVVIRCPRTIRLSRVSPHTGEANCPLQFARSLDFYSPSMYFWYTLETVNLENPSCLTISETE
ncbi:hypothetical protein TNCV_4767561 [Trichonephila clavipes]|nr:hypothetical protein TNCV_4767561 [Trichonephila clavipes]